MLITAAEFKQAFPQWEKYVRLGSQEDAATVEARLERVLARASTELLEFVPTVTDQNITAPLKRHLVNVGRKNAFDIQHGNSAFENKPQIIRDYEATLAMLERYRTGEFAAPAPDADGDGEPDTGGDVRVTAKPRRFRDWFIGESGS